ncbi:unnamed protein product [Zymoseptoria tritici ST99CH_3D7]|uniref:Fungal N-terminal domain-containing protein n=2 Tax=Zymoseptoria tritici TaxID=1047171 RepID=A0A1X7RI91_ZYMT9|nr:unnamed protein product [Zymoseptoria tritici ST99CH_3D7]SMR43264.1 unnamed protein product [Zymoseptoria tritici ST99CH_1E4]
MSFGFSPSDIVTLVNLAHKTYRGWKTACGDYADITSSLDGLLVLLERIENEAEQPHTALIRSRKDRDNVRDIISACTATIQELSSIISRYRSLGLGKSREKNWEKICFGSKNLDSLKAKLVQHQSALSAYLSAVGLSSLTRIEQDLHALPDRIQKTVDGLAAEIRAGRREGSVMTTYDDDEKDVWRQFRRELIGDGMRSSFVHRYKPQIRRYLRDLADDGLLEEAELPAEDQGSSDAFPPASSGKSEDDSPALQSAPLPSHRYQATCVTDSSSDHESEQEACPDDVTLMERGNGIPAVEKPVVSEMPLRANLATSPRGSPMRDDFETSGGVDRSEPEKNDAAAEATAGSSSESPLPLEDGLYFSDGVPIASSVTSGSLNPNLCARASSPAGAFLERLITIREETAHAWSSSGDTSSHVSEQWSTLGANGAEPDDAKPEPSSGSSRARVAPGTTGTGACGITALPKDIFSSHALRYLNYNFNEFNGFFHVYDRVTESDIANLIEVHDDLFNPYAWTDLDTLTDHDSAILDCVAGKKTSSETHWRTGLDSHAVTLLPQSAITSAAILANGHVLHRRIGGYYVVRASLNSEQIQDLRMLSVSLRRPLDGFIPRRAKSPTRNATCTLDAKEAHAKPFTITTESEVEEETGVETWIKTWFPKASYSMWTMLALGCVIEQQERHFIICDASPKMAARTIEVAIEVNGQVASAQASGKAISLSYVQHLVETEKKRWFRRVSEL